MSSPVPVNSYFSYQLVNKTFGAINQIFNKKCTRLHVKAFILLHVKNQRHNILLEEFVKFCVTSNKLRASKIIQSLSYVKLGLLLPKAENVKAIIHNYLWEISDYYV